MTDNRKLKELFSEKGWPGELLEGLSLLHSLPSRPINSYPYLEDPYESIPIDPKHWTGILLKYGFFAIGDCANGDFIALDCSGDIGGVVYINHEKFDYNPDSTGDITGITRQVAGSIKEFLKGIEDNTIPPDYFS